jgi:ribose 5-phosphate isomerase B
MVNRPMNKLFKKMKIVLGCDHAAFECKNLVKKYLIKNNFNVEDVGCFDDKPVDYPDIAGSAAKKIQNEEVGNIIIF